jgi:hypothetical protein
MRTTLGRTAKHRACPGFRPVLRGSDKRRMSGQNRPSHQRMPRASSSTETQKRLKNCQNELFVMSRGRPASCWPAEGGLMWTAFFVDRYPMAKWRTCTRFNCLPAQARRSRSPGGAESFGCPRRSNVMTEALQMDSQSARCHRRLRRDSATDLICGIPPIDGTCACCVDASFRILAVGLTCLNS